MRKQCLAWREEGEEIYLQLPCGLSPGKEGDQSTNVSQMEEVIKGNSARASNPSDREHETLRGFGSRWPPMTAGISLPDLGLMSEGDKAA